VIIRRTHVLAASQDKKIRNASTLRSTAKMPREKEDARNMNSKDSSE